MANPILPNGNVAQRLVDESTDALIALALDGRIISWNRGARSIFGYAADEVVGRPLVALLVPEDRITEAQAALNKAVESGSVEFETVRRRKDGVLIQVEVSHSFVELPHDEPFIAVREKDVTRLKRALLPRVSHDLRSPLNTIIGFADLMHRGKIGSLSAEQHEYLGDILTSARNLLRVINDILDDLPSPEPAAHDGR